MDVRQNFRSLLTENPEIEKSDLLELLHWVKQIIALAFGLLMGVLKFQGFYVIIGFVIVLSFSSMMYTWNIIKTEEFETFDLVKESFMVSFMLFLLCWTLSFTFI